MGWVGAPISCTGANTKVSGTQVVSSLNPGLAAGDLFIVVAGGVTSTSHLADLSSVTVGGLSWMVTGWVDGGGANSGSAMIAFGVAPSTVAASTSVVATMAGTCKAMAMSTWKLTGVSGLTNAKVQGWGQESLETTTNAPTITTFSTTSLNDIIIGCAASNGTATTTEDTGNGFTSLGDSGTSGGSAASNFQIHAAYAPASFNTGAGVTMTYSPTLSSSVLSLVNVEAFHSTAPQAPAPGILFARQAIARASNW